MFIPQTPVIGDVIRFCGPEDSGTYGECHLILTVEVINNNARGYWKCKTWSFSQNKIATIHLHPGYFYTGYSSLTWQYWATDYEPVTLPK